MRWLSIKIVKPGYRCLDCGFEGDRKGWASKPPDSCPKCAPPAGGKRYATAHMVDDGEIRCSACDHVSPGRLGMTHCDSCGIRFNRLRSRGGAILSPRLIGK